MKIGLVLDHFDPRRGGVEQWTWQLAARLLQAGHEVHVIAAGFGPREETPEIDRVAGSDHREGPESADRGHRVRSDPTTHREEPKPTARCREEPQNTPRPGSSEAASIVPHRFTAHRSRLARAQAAENVLRRLELDVIHDMGVGWYCDVFQPHGGSRRASFEQNLLLSRRCWRPWKRMAARLLPRYREFDVLTARQYADDGRIVLALSEMVRRDLRRFHHVPDKQIRLIYNGVDTRRFSPENRSTHRDAVRQRLGLGDEVLFLIVAHNLRLKGLPTLLKAIGLLESAPHAVRLAVVGGKRTEPFRRMARRLGVSRQVRFIGAVEDAVPYYAAADVYVQPTFYDPCSLVVLEALASGLPVITTRFNGAGELMTPGEHGYLLDDPADAVTLSRQMSQLLDDGRRRQMSLDARKLALQHSLDDNVNRVLAVYGEKVES